jgi:hypothetical protein
VAMILDSGTSIGRHIRMTGADCIMRHSLIIVMGLLGGQVACSDMSRQEGAQWLAPDVPEPPEPEPSEPEPSSPGVIGEIIAIYPGDCVENVVGVSPPGSTFLFKSGRHELGDSPHSPGFATDSAQSDCTGPGGLPLAN